MVQLSDFLTELSIIAPLDGKCCDHESTLGYAGLILWVLLVVFLIIGQFVLCEEYFVPLLTMLGNRLNMPDNVQGATLLAVGSSSPELFTAIIGALFIKPENNPGPGTNVGSAVFNLCAIIGLSAVVAPRVVKLEQFPFIRDSVSYVLGVVVLFLFYGVITPHEMDLWEAILLIAYWALYVFVVYKSEAIEQRFFPESYKKSQANGALRASLLDSITEEKAVEHGAGGAPAPVEDDAKIRDEDDAKQSVLDMRGVTTVSHHESVSLKGLTSGHTQRLADTLAVTMTVKVADHHTHSTYSRRRTFMETLRQMDLDREAALSEGGHPPENHGGKWMQRIAKPWVLLYHYGVPEAEGDFAADHMVLAMLCIILWLGILTFFVVDCTEKIGHCLGIPGDLLGLTLLAVGSSVPDLIASMLVAKQMKIDMAVSNAFGSNVFDVNFCLGVGFFLGSLANFGGGATDLGSSSTFIVLIGVAAGIQVMLWVLLRMSSGRLLKAHGYILLTVFLIYAVVFSVLLMSHKDEEAHDECAAE